ncbi:structural maintenance of chromosome 1 [Nematocida major]|uniref:structural maintenance of chromosome 1 n=1 Tax=Nematocida major TaxID=1912982 RepID=UPI00200805F0|nr:structural maintenance of chromosome 1 [Nematocida major]KAH9385731.1 structural maintenance of chromosome 1 [Nematocida major]
MAILSLKILSFKTYDKVENIPFSAFTCIVGPNGSGKSNLVDALLFVLGSSTSEIRGTLAARSSPSPTAVEVSLRGQTGVVVRLRRELHNEVSSFFIDDRKVAQSEYAAYLEGQNISTVHRNFLISQNESLIKSPKDLTKFIDKISGSFAMKEEYRSLKESKDAHAREYQEILDRKRAAEVSSREYEEVLLLRKKHAELLGKKRVISSAKIRGQRESIKEAKADLKKRLQEAERKHEISSGQGTAAPGQREIASLHTELIKCRAMKAGVRHREDAKKEKAEEAERAQEERRKRVEELQEKIAEASAHIEEADWHARRAKESTVYNERYEREMIVRALSEIQKIEDSKSILQLKIELGEIRREIKEAEKKDAEAPPEEKTSKKLAQLNQALLETLKEISKKAYKTKEGEYSARLGYLISRIKSTVPHVLGRVCDLVTCREEKYRQAVHALLHGKRNVLIIEQEKHALSILNGLAQSGAGRVTILPLNRLHAERELSACKENRSAQKSASVPAGYVLCRDVVQVPGEGRAHFEKILEYVCGNALIYTGDGSPAENRAGEKVVTLDGVVISRDGVVRKVSAAESAGGLSELEERRDRLLAEIQREGKMPCESGPGKSREVAELEEKYAAAQRHLEEAEEDVREKVQRVLEGSKIPENVIRQAKEEGIIDSSSAERKAEQFLRKKTMWKNRLDILQEHLGRLQREKEKDAPEEDSPEESAEALGAQIEMLEARILEAAKREPCGEIEIKIIKEQILSLDDELEEIEQYMAEEGITEEEVRSAPAPAGEDLEKVRREIDSVRALLQRKGAVAETHKIFAQIESEAEEKKHVLAEVSKNFHRVRKERASLFLGTFDRINSLINKKYAKLTENVSGHVRAHLGLENPVEPYLAGTQIFVMPTGKTFREAKYLSGGEKTMVALALLLSVDSIYPSMFYIFDELDAALDRDKIASLRASLQEIQAQFIAVTHRIELFETADTLVGVARPPSGHSQVFTLRL